MKKEGYIYDIGTELGFEKYARSQEPTRSEEEVKQLCNEMMELLQGLTKSQIDQLLSLSSTSRLIRYVREDFLAEKLSPVIASKDIPTVQDEAYTEKVRFVAQALNPVEIDSRLFVFEDLGSDIKEKKIQATIKLFRRIFLLGDREQLPSFIVDVEQYQRENHYMKSAEGKPLYPQDQYYGRFAEMLEYGLGLDTKEAEELEAFLRAGFDAEREARLLYRRLRIIKGFLKRDGYNDQSKAQMKDALADFFAPLSAQRTRNVLSAYKQLLEGLTVDVRSDIIHLPPSPEKKQLLALLRGRKETRWDRVRPEDFEVLSPEEIARKYLPRNASSPLREELPLRSAVNQK